MFMQKLAFDETKSRKKLRFPGKNPENPNNLRHYPNIPYNPYILATLKI